MHLLVVQDVAHPLHVVLDSAVNQSLTVVLAILGGELQFCFNTGMAANSASTFSLGYALIYRPNPKPTENRTGFALSLKLDNGKL